MSSYIFQEIVLITAAFLAGGVQNLLVLQLEHSAANKIIVVHLYFYFCRQEADNSQLPSLPFG